jgi:putative chitinase
MSLTALQTKIGVTADGSFGPTTMKKAMEYLKLTAPQAAHFFGQCSTETGGFVKFVENLNYSAEALTKLFGKYFLHNDVTSYARQPEKIANHIYSLRMGNGNEASGDGWKYRGRGALQTTGKSNYQALSKSLQVPEILTNPDLVATTYAFESAIYFFNSNKLWQYCNTVDTTSITLVSKAVNLGNAHSKGTPIHLQDRIDNTLKYYQYVK